MLQTTAPWINYRVPDSLPDNTEESVVGIEWHQEAIGDLAGKLREAGRRQNATRGVCEQVALTGLRHTDGRAYDPRPDVFVLSHPLPSGGISAIALDDAGAPLFIAEVASRSTMGDDTHGSVHEQRSRIPSAPHEEGGHGCCAVGLAYRAGTHCHGIGSEHDIGVEYGEKRVQSATLRDRKNGHNPSS